MSKGSAEQLLSDRLARRAGTHLVITVHGIRTFGQWQDRLGAILGQCDPAIELCHYKYGYFSCFAFMIPFLRWIVTRQFRSALLDLMDDTDWQRVDIVAHSFGTHLVAWALHGIPADRRPHIHTVILAGSVLKPSFPWYQLMPQWVRRLVNECGTRDSVLLLNQAVVLFTGMAGRVGFVGFNDDRSRNRFYTCGHSDYFLEDGKPSDEFMRRQWVPLLCRDDPIAAVEDPRQSTLIQGAITFALSNAEPIKLAVYLAPFVILTFLFFMLYQRADDQRQIAERALTESRRSQHVAEVQRALARDGLVQLQLASAQRRCEEGDVAAALPWYVEALAADEQSSQRQHDHRVRIATTLRQYPALMQMWFLPDWYPRQPTFSPDGTRIATAGGPMKECGARIWDIATGVPTTPVLKHENIVTSIAFSPDGKLLATVGNDYAACVWDAFTGKRLYAPLQLNGRGTAVVFSPDGKHFLTVAEVRRKRQQSEARIWDTASGAPIGQPMPAELSIHHAAFNPEGSRIVTISEGSVARVWDAATSEPVTPSIDTQNKPNGIAQAAWAQFSPDGEQIVTADTNAVCIWNSTTGKPTTRPMPFDDVAYAAYFDDVAIVGVDRSGNSQLFNASTGTPIHRLRRHGRGYNSFVVHVPTQQIAVPDSDLVRIWGADDEDPKAPPLHHGVAVEETSFSLDGSRLVTTSNDGFMRLWDLEPRDAHVLDHEELYPFGYINRAVISPDQSRVVTIAAEHGDAMVWDPRTQKRVFNLENSGFASFVEFSPTGDRIVTTSRDGAARLWDARTGRPISKPLPHDKRVGVAAFSADGKLLVTGSDDGYARFWNAHTGKPLFEPVHYGAEIVAVAFTPDAKTLFIAGGATGALYDVATAQELTPDTPRSEVGIMDGALAPDGRHFIIAGLEGAAFICDAQSGHAIAPPLVHHAGPNYANLARRINHCEFSPDGRLVLTASTDGTTRVWDAVTGAPAAPALAEGNYAAFSADSRWVVTGGPTGTVRVWDAHSGLAISPLLEHNSIVMHAVFCRDNLSVLTSAWDGTTRIWDLSPDTRSLETLRNCAQLLTCQKIESTGGLVSLTSEEIQSAWTALHPMPATSPTSRPTTSP